MRPKWIVFLSLLACFSSPAFPQAPNAFVVRDVRLFDGRRVAEHRSVLVMNGRISKISGPKLNVAGAEVIDGRGRTLLPGLIDAHVHVGNEEALRQALVFGVTTVLDMFTTQERLKMMKRVEAEDPPDLADVRTAGIGAAAPHGHPTQMGGPPFPTISSPQEAQAFVDQRIAEGSDFIKLIYDDLSAMGPPVPMLGLPTISALVVAAHRRHKVVVIHVMAEQRAREAIAAHVDGLAHMFVGKSASPDFGRFAAQHHVFVIPTLVTLYSACGIGDGKALLADPHLAPYVRPNFARGLSMAWPANPDACRGTDEGMHQLITEHVPILAGTDAAIPGTTYGASLHGELELLVKEGMTPVEALAAATSVPAHYFHLDDRGRIRAGARADLLLVEGDPTRDILATRNIVAVWKRGIPVSREKNP